MSYIIDSVKKLSVGTSAVTEAAACRHFMIQNNSADATVYFKEKNGADATASNAFALGPGKTFEHVLNANELSLIASAASTDVRILYVSEGW